MVSIVKLEAIVFIRILVEGKTIEFIENGSTKLTSEDHKNCII